MLDEMVLKEKLKDYNIILASGSPRRRQLMNELGLEFRVEPRPVEESFPNELTPEEAAEYLSRLKSDAFPSGEMALNELLITADTVVTLDGEMLGKPGSREEAVDILEKLSGKTHQVITGVTIKTREYSHTFSVTTDVDFKVLAKDEISFYIDTYQPFDKAGAYGIQEWIGHAAIERIEGSYFNVMGLPTHRLYEELISFVSKDA
jgi:septum formation protein